MRDKTKMTEYEVKIMNRTLKLQHPRNGSIRFVVVRQCDVDEQAYVGQRGAIWGYPGFKVVEII